MCFSLTVYFFANNQASIQRPKRKRAETVPFGYSVEFVSQGRCDFVERYKKKKRGASVFSAHLVHVWERPVCIIIHHLMLRDLSCMYITFSFIFRALYFHLKSKSIPTIPTETITQAPKYVLMRVNCFDD